jgi:hypothetical protein
MQKNLQNWKYSANEIPVIRIENWANQRRGVEDFGMYVR